MPGSVLTDPTPDWLKPENASVTDTALTKAMRMIGHLIGADNPTAQVLGLMMTDVPGGSATGGLAKAVEGLKARVIKAYHGSPHDFERFSLEKIGTGEGAQAYGPGLYFAEHEPVAEQYRRVLSGMDVVLPSGERLNSRAAKTATERRAINYLHGGVLQHGNNPTAFDDAVSALEHRGNTYDDDVSFDAANLVKSWKEQGAQFLPAGKTYEVAIHADPEHFLDWDKPLHEQSEQVKSAIDKIGFSPKPVIPWKPVQLKALDERFPDVHPGQWVVIEKDAQGRVTGWNGRGLNSKDAAVEHAAARNSYKAGQPFRDKGEEVFRDLAKSDVAAREKLKQAGIPGIKYLDQGSRAAGEGSRNYVVFDDRLIDILKKYGLLLPAAGGAGQATISRRSE